MSPTDRPQAPDAVGGPDAADAAQATRRCWRCLHAFICSPDDVGPGPAEWWLCDPCQLALIGPRTGSRA